MKTRRVGTKKLRVVLYLRISQDRDDQQSIENQEREGRAYAALHGWEVVAVLKDVGKSGYKPGTKRPGFDQAMNMVRTKQADLFLVWKVSRFIRRIREFHMFLNELVKAGGQFDSVTDPVDYTTASGELLLAMTAGFAQMESAAKADFAESWNEGRTAKGAVPQGPRPFGYDRLERDEAPRDKHGQAITLKPNPVEAEVIRFAAEWVLTGKSLRSAVKELGGLVGTKEAPLTIRGLKSALVSPTTAGLRAVKERDEHGKTHVLHYVDGCWPAILPRDQWEAVKELLTDPERGSHIPGTEVRHLLSGIMSCGKEGCHGKVGARKWKQNAGTNTNGTPRKAYDCYRYVCYECFNSATETVVDEAVKARLLALVPQDAWTQLKQQGRGYDPEVIRAIEQDQLRLAKMWKANQITMEVFQMMNAECVTRMAQATGAEPLDLPDFDNLADAWDDPTTSVVDKRRVLAVVFSEIKLDPANGSRDTISRLFLRRAV
jgi:DNA invertase Pin-like site-specific DNA recombinase